MLKDAKNRQVRCNNCHWTGSEADEKIKPLHKCHGLNERLDPGAVVPVGDCPNCGAFVYFTDIPEGP